jgi:hypothetical protein
MKSALKSMHPRGSFLSTGLAVALLWLLGSEVLFSNPPPSDCGSGCVRWPLGRSYVGNEFECGEHRNFVRSDPWDCIANHPPTGYTPCPIPQVRYVNTYTRFKEYCKRNCDFYCCDPPAGSSINCPSCDCRWLACQVSGSCIDLNVRNEFDGDEYTWGPCGPAVTCV